MDYRGRIRRRRYRMARRGNLGRSRQHRSGWTRPPVRPRVHVRQLRRRCPDFVIQQKGFRRPVGFAFHHSDAYFKNIFNELDARCQDLKHIGDFTQVSGFTRYDKVADERQQRFERLCEVLQQMTLRRTDDVIQMLHQRLQDEFPEYALYDVISGVQVLVSQQQSRTNNANNFRFMTTNRFAQIQHAHQTYRYRKIRCVSTEIKEN